MNAAAMWPSIIAVCGTLAGGLVTGLIQSRLARTARRDARVDARREAQLAAVTALVSALADHRRAMWVREDLQLRNADQHKIDEARAESHNTRSAITAPLATAAILVPCLAMPANKAADATYAMRGAPDHDTLAALRESAINASDHLIALAGQHLETGMCECRAVTAMDDREETGT